MPSREATFFDRPEDFGAWLAEHHANRTELWVGFRKRHTGRASITWPESVDEALCFGWIDGLRQSIDADSYRIRFTPRKPTSIWSAVNLRRMVDLIERGRVHPAGLAAYERRTASRQGVYSHENPQHRLPADDEGRLRADDAAWAYWSARPPSYRKAAVHWVLSAKRAPTRDRRMAELVAACAEQRVVAPFTWATRTGRD